MCDGFFVSIQHISNLPGTQYISSPLTLHDVFSSWRTAAKGIKGRRIVVTRRYQTPTPPPPSTTSFFQTFSIFNMSDAANIARGHSTSSVIHSPALGLDCRSLSHQGQTCTTPTPPKSPRSTLAKSSRRWERKYFPLSTRRTCRMSSVVTRFVRPCQL